jgi:hypothetical protein
MHSDAGATARNQLSLKGGYWSVTKAKAWGNRVNG